MTKNATSLNYLCNTFKMTLYYHRTEEALQVIGQRRNSVQLSLMGLSGYWPCQVTLLDCDSGFFVMFQISQEHLQRKRSARSMAWPFYADKLMIVNGWSLWNQQGWADDAILSHRRICMVSCIVAMEKLPGRSRNHLWQKGEDINEILASWTSELAAKIGPVSLLSPQRR